MQAFLILVGLMVGAIAAGWLTRLFVRRISGDAPPPGPLDFADAVIVVWAYLTVPVSLILPITCTLGWVLVALAACDAKTFRLPDVLTLPLVAIGIALAWLLPGGDIVGHVIGAAVGFAVFALIAFVYERVRKREGLGLGDAKLMAAAGAWLGWEALPSVILMGAAGGLLWVMVRYLFNGTESIAERIPFGVPLCAAFWLAWLYGPVVPSF